MEQNTQKQKKYGELAKCLVYAIIINILGGLSYWYTVVLKDILKNDFGVQFEYEITEIIFDFYNWFVIGEILSGFLWTYILKYMTTRTCILVSLVCQAAVYIIQYFMTSIEAIFFCRVLQGFFNNINSLGKTYVFEFADVDYISVAFSMKGFIAILLQNFFPQIGVKIYELFGKNFQITCLFWFGFNAVIAIAFYFCFFVWSYSENTQEAVNKRNRLLKDAENNKTDAKVAEAKDKKDEKEVHYGLGRVFKHIISDPVTIKLFIVYILTKSIHKAIQGYKTVIFLKDRDLGGMAFEQNELSLWHTICIGPSFLIIFA